MDSRYLEAVVVGIITAFVAAFAGLGAPRNTPGDGQSLQPRAATVIPYGLISIKGADKAK